MPSAYVVGGGGEEEAGDDEDERRQAEREDRGEAERVVDRGADVAVGGREERRGAENSLEALLSPPAAVRTLLTLAGRRQAERSTL